ncbi:hypothetical protein ABK040_005384 [Willaertia magna]
MDYLVDSLTRVPSQVLVKSATNFGEEAAKIFGTVLEESLKNMTDDITVCLKEGLNSAEKKISKELERFGQVIKETGVEGFTEWGIGIERAFYHLGHKLENGLNNATNRISSQLDVSINNNVNVIEKSLEKNVTFFTTNFLKEQTVNFKNNFVKELNIVMISLLLMAIGFFIFCISFAFNGILDVKYLTILILMILNGYALFIWNNTLNNNLNNNLNNLKGDNLNDKFTIHYLNNPNILLFIILIFGFFLGQISNDIFYENTFFNSLIYLIIIILTILFIYKLLVFEIIKKCYHWWREFNEFLEFKKQLKKNNDDNNNDNSSMKGNDDDNNDNSTNNNTSSSSGISTLSSNNKVTTFTGTNTEVITPTTNMLITKSTEPRDVVYSTTNTGIMEKPTTTVTPIQNNKLNVVDNRSTLSTNTTTLDKKIIEERSNNDPLSSNKNKSILENLIDTEVDEDYEDNEDDDNILHQQSYESPPSLVVNNKPINNNTTNKQEHSLNIENEEKGVLIEKDDWLNILTKKSTSMSKEEMTEARNDLLFKKMLRSDSMPNLNMNSSNKD